MHISATSSISSMSRVSGFGLCFDCNTFAEDVKDLGSSSNHDGCISDETIIDGLQKECMVEGNIGTAVNDQMLDNHNSKRLDETSINLGGLECLIDMISGVCEKLMVDAKGTDVDLSTYKGKALLIVNVASQCFVDFLAYEFLSCNDEDRRDARSEVEISGSDLGMSQVGDVQYTLFHFDSSRLQIMGFIKNCKFVKFRLSFSYLVVVARFDFSWGDVEYHQETLENLKIAIKTTKKLCVVMLDTIGPELQIVNNSQHSISLEADSCVQETSGADQTTPDQPVDDEAVYYKVAGDCPKGCVYSLKSLWRKKRRYVDPDASTSQVLAQRGMDNFMILSTPKQLLEGVQAMEQVLWLYFQMQLKVNVLLNQSSKSSSLSAPVAEYFLDIVLSLPIKLKDVLSCLLSNHPQVGEGGAQLRSMSIVSRFNRRERPRFYFSRPSKIVETPTRIALAKMPKENNMSKDIDPNTVNWYADVYDLEKLPIKQSNTSSVRQQRLILVDEEGYRIRATIFGNDINLFESRLQTKVAYRISNAFVKEIEARYRLVPSPHQWSISRNTLIKKVMDSKTFPLIEEAKFVTLDEIDEYLDIDEYIDVAVLALIAKPRRDVTKRNGQPSSLQELIVIDEWICLATRSSSTIDLVDDSERAQTLRQWFNRNCTVIEDLINNDGMSMPIHFRNPIVRPSQQRPLVTIAKINSMLNDVKFSIVPIVIMKMHTTLLGSKQSHGCFQIIEICLLFYVYVQADKLVDNTIIRFFLVGISPINVEIGNLDLNGDNGNIDGPLVANAQTSVCGSARLKETNGEVILHTIASATTISKRETSNFTSRSSKLLKPVVVSLESASTSSG
ncbi:hypothetical protein Syun_022889 [Stephania yunnanensis]|uniref:pyruvate kinase n=1 Tax=Stephania yunnanensis TaxID=152371 RepID=A0AAP0FEN9_9MAGN